MTTSRFGYVEPAIGVEQLVVGGRSESTLTRWPMTKSHANYKQPRPGLGVASLDVIY